MQRYIRLVLMLAAFLIWPAANASTAKVAAPLLSELGANLIAFPTIESYLDAHRDIGLISSSEHAALTEYLRQKKINVKTALKAGKLENNKVTFGQASLTEQGPGIWVTNNGVQLKMDEYKSADEAFRAVYAAMTERKSAGLEDLLLPKAYAFDALEAAQAALIAVPYHALKSFTNVVILGVAGGTMTAFSALASPLIRIAGKLNKKGSIACKGQDYVVHGGFMDPDMQKVYSKYDEFREFAKGQKARGKDSAIDAYTPEIAGLVMAEANYMEQVWNPERPEDEQRVDEKFVTKTFGGKVVPCNPKNADKVSLTMKDEALQIAAAAIRASNKAPKGSSSKPADAIR